MKELLKTPLTSLVTLDISNTLLGIDTIMALASNGKFIVYNVFKNILDKLNKLENLITFGCSKLLAE